MPSIFWKTIIIVAVVLSFSTLLGRIVSLALPIRLGASGRFYLAPSFGLGTLTIIASVLGRHLALGNSIVVPCAMLALLAGILVLEKDRWGAFRQAILVSCFGMACGAAVLRRLFIYGAFSTNNDAFTYLAQSDWLQNHAFRESISLDSLTPLTSQILTYQTAGLRMGASYLLALTQAIANQRWSFDVYPAVVIVAITACCLATGFPLARYLGSMNRGTRLALLVLPTFTLGGLMSGSALGFLPQTIGLAFGGSLLFFIGAAMWWVSTQDADGKAMVKTALPGALLFAALTFAYSELMPFIVLAILASALWISLQFGSWRKIMLYGLIFAGISALLLNTEILRAIAAVRLQSHVVVGMPVDWSLMGFVAHAFGVHGGAWEALTWAARANVGSSSFWKGMIVFVVPAALVVWNSKSIWRSTRRGELMPVSVALAMIFAGIFYFRYCVPSPFPVGVGSSWSEFKLSEWSGPFVMVLVLLGISRLRRSVGRRFNGTVAVVFVTGFVATAVVPPPSLGASFGPFINYYGSPRDLERFYLNFRDTVFGTCPRGGPIYLDLHGNDMKAREMVALYLRDQRLKSKWTDDDYFNQYVLSGGKSEPLAVGDCVVASSNDPKYTGSGVPVGPFRVSVFDGHENIGFAAVTGAYDMESDGSEWWRWVRKEVTFTLDGTGALSPSSHAKLAFGYQTKGPQLLTVHVVARDGSTKEFQISSAGGAPERFEQVIDIPRVGLSAIKIGTNVLPTPLGAADSRVAAWNVRNLSVSFSVQDN